MVGIWFLKESGNGLLNCQGLTFCVDFNLAILGIYLNFCIHYFPTKEVLENVGFSVTSVPLSDLTLSNLFYYTCWILMNSYKRMCLLPEISVWISEGFLVVH